nr:MAG TPA: hypothetical protein [Caudoviricetes sp.]
MLAIIGSVIHPPVIYWILLGVDVAYQIMEICTTRGEES